MERHQTDTDDRDWTYLLLSVAAYVGFFFGITFLVPVISRNILLLLTH